MKKTIGTILCAAAVVLAAVSCQKSIEQANPAEEGKGTIDICVSGLMGEYTQQDGVKSSLVNNVRVAWAAGDVVYVFDGSNYLGKLTAALDKKADGQTDEDRYAKLGGTISAPATTPCVLSLVHSSLMTEPAAGAAVSELSIDMSTQSTETVPFVAYATMDYTGESISDVVVPFQFATSVIKVNCTGLKANTAIDKAKLSNVNTVCKLTLSRDGAPTVSGVTNGTITRTGDEYFAATNVNSEGEAVFQIAVPKLETASGARVLTVAQSSDKVKDKKFTTKSLNPATSVNTVCQLVGLPVGALKGEFTVSDDDGATTKQIYFSKGNLYYDGSKCNFEANQYDFRTYNGSGSCINGTYNNNSGTPSGHCGLFTWSSTVDAAVGTSNSGDFLFTNADGFKVNVGGTDQTGWRTLSTKEWQYLFNKENQYGETCRSGKYKYGVTVCGVTNCVVIAPDGWDLSANSLQSEYSSTSTPMTWEQAETAGLVCLPAAGFRDGSNVYNVGDYGFYWSSTAFGSDLAYIVYFNSNYVYPDYGGFRDRGVSVRLITESN